MNAPLLSIETFKAVDSGITIMQYLILYTIIYILGYTILTMLICDLSGLIRKSIPVICSVICITLIPLLLVYTGFHIASYFDFTSILSVTSLFLLSAKLNFLNDSGFMVIFMVLWIGIIFIINFYAYKKWNN